MAFRCRSVPKNRDESMKDRQLYSIAESRELLGGISRNTIYVLLRAGDLSSVVIGRRRFISAAAIADFITASTTTMSPPDDLIGTQHSTGLQLQPTASVRLAGRRRGVCK
jgi:hypothetical protein